MLKSLILKVIGSIVRRSSKVHSFKNKKGVDLGPPDLVKPGESNTQRNYFTPNESMDYDYTTRFDMGPKISGKEIPRSVFDDS